MSQRILPNKCLRTRVEIEGKSYRAISFFHEHPSETAEDAWSIFRPDEDQVYLVDKLTLAVMAECECELLTRAVDSESEEPTIVSVQLNDK